MVHKQYRAEVVEFQANQAFEESEDNHEVNQVALDQVEVDRLENDHVAMVHAEPGWP